MLQLTIFSLPRVRVILASVKASLFFTLLNIGAINKKNVLDMLVIFKLDKNVR